MKRQFDKKKIFVGILAILIFSFLFIKSIYNYNQYFTVNKDIVGMRFLNIITLALSSVVLYKFSKEFLNENHAFSASLLFLVTPIITYTIVEWTHITSVFFVLVIFYGFYLYMKTNELKWLIIFSVFSGFLGNIRYVEVVMIIPLLIYITYTIIKNKRYNHLILFSLLFTISISPTLLFQYMHFGNPFLTPYHLRPYSLGDHPKTNIAKEFDVTRSISTIPYMLIDFNPDKIPPTTGDTDYSFRYFKSSVLQSTPFFSLSVFGICFLFKESKKFITLLILSMSLITITYSSWVYYGGGWTVSMRYLSTLIPFLLIFAMAAVQKLKIEKSYMLLNLLITIPLIIFLLILPLRNMTYPSALNNVPQKRLMNPINLFLSIALLLSYTIHYLTGNKLLSKITLSLFVVSIASSIVMVFIVDNIITFTGSYLTLFIYNFSSSFFMSLTFLSSLIYLILYLTNKI
ncbi:MAG: glycosyltransferase family 39 protein [Candidatus Aenigmarchaeota archaeon]|nr:glycosyltransferase family 39 protein [Candidatus Aenigmarchaeota archaeon]